MLQDRIDIIRGDITRLQVDAIVNAANSALCGGGGVDGAIHRAAGPQLLQECRTLGRCETGYAKATKAYNLPAQWGFHAVGPVWRGGDANEDAQLASCYRECFRLAQQYAVTSMAFPAISCGVYRFPIARACQIAMREAAAGLQHNPQIERVIFACFDGQVEDATRKAYAEIAGSDESS
ncbi:O-acetyl-ADP-ribose deacetylase [Hahella sp. NBU794]|uniref:O-acetyl-ADP-ribose deacetylase n=1 Tax=Hahella sp. NBU794 TaxID=3422590 RepID=UPI003D6F52EC